MAVPDITIPPEALKAALDTIKYSSATMDETLLEAACLAMLKAWPRQTYDPPVEKYGVMQRAYLTLPLQQEPAHLTPDQQDAMHGALRRSVTVVAEPAPRTDSRYNNAQRIFGDD